MTLPFTPQDVIEAYEKTGLMPTRNEWAGNVSGKNCGCALTALYVSKAEDQEAAFQKILEHSILDFDTEKIFGYDTSLIRCFTDGFDGVIKRSPWSEDMLAAHTLGAETWNAVETHFKLEGEGDE